MKIFKPSPNMFGDGGEVYDMELDLPSTPLNYFGEEE
jgi:hypothetical protein